ncbi:MAG: hypothetical protein CSA45_05645 [Gammaproteobacteria bacterium]|nr:MAG: hypothetical protein CSA45_05645 [Gammaproteobacteria bacterium]
MKKICCITLLLTAASVAFADNCARPQNTFDSLYCARKIFFSLDDDLNKSYQALRKQLNAEGKARLKNSQLKWIAARNSACVVESRGAVIVDCAVEMTRERLYFLKDRLHECNSVGCINDNL